MPVRMGRLGRMALGAALIAGLSACAGAPQVTRGAAPGLALQAGETPQMRALIDRVAAEQGVPASLVHRVVRRESGYRPGARNGPYYGLMQLLPQTARTMGHGGAPGELLDAETNLRYGVRYLRGAWMLSGGDPDGAVRRYASGYYYEARDRCMLVETGLKAREVSRACR